MSDRSRHAQLCLDQLLTGEDVVGAVGGAQNCVATGWITKAEYREFLVNVSKLFGEFGDTATQTIMDAAIYRADHNDDSAIMLIVELILARELPKLRQADSMCNICRGHGTRKGWPCACQK